MVTDPNVSVTGKVGAAALFGAGLIGPGAAYGRIGDAAIATARARQLGAAGEAAVRSAFEDALRILGSIREALQWNHVPF